MSYCDWFLLKKIARQVAAGVSHAATCRVALRKVEAASTFSATCNAIFRCEISCKHGVSHEEVFLATCNAMQRHCIASCKDKLSRLTWPLGIQRTFHQWLNVKPNLRSLKSLQFTLVVTIEEILTIAILLR